MSPDLTGAGAGQRGLRRRGHARQRAALRLRRDLHDRALAARRPKEIWVGTDDGLIQLTRDGGKTWKNVTPKGLPVWGKVATLDAVGAGARHAPTPPSTRIGWTTSRRTLYRTRDFGETWQAIVDRPAAGALRDVLRADPVRTRPALRRHRRGRLRLLRRRRRTGSRCSSTCRRLGRRPRRSTATISSPRRRGARSGCSTTSRRCASSRRSAAAAPARVLAPAAADPRARQPEPRHAAAGRRLRSRRNPPAGAMLDYVLTSPAGPVTPRDPGRARARRCAAFSQRETTSVPRANANVLSRDAGCSPPAPPATAPGHHRFVWDLRYPPSAGGPGYEFMIAAVCGKDTPVEPRGPLVLPGRYTVRLTADGRRSEQPLRVTMDPRVTVPAETLAAQLDFQRQVMTINSSFATLKEVRGFRRAREASGGRRAGAAADARLAAREAHRSRETTRRRAPGGEGPTRPRTRPAPRS